MADAPFLTAVTLDVPADRELELVAGYRDLVAGERPDGLVRSELLRGRDGRWLIQSLWRDRDAVLAARASGVPPLAVLLAERVGAEHTHDVFTVEAALAD